MARTAATTGTPVQIWDCGIAGHRHVTKAEAVSCLEAHETAAATAAGEHGEDPAEGAVDDPYGEVDYADPGYRPDARQRYPIDTERHIRAAWAFIHLPGNAGHYTAGQLERIKARIIAAWQEKIDRAGPPSAAFGQSRAAAPVTKAADPPLVQHLQGIIAELCDFLQSLVGEEGAELIDGDDGPAHADLAALAIAATLRKRHQPDLAPLADGLAKLAGEIVPRLDALQKRVEEIARTPLPPQTVARGFIGISKREDADAAVPPAEDVVAALARMSDEERTLTLIKAAHANPIAPVGRPGDLRRDSTRARDPHPNPAAMPGFSCPSGRTYHEPDPGHPRSGQGRAAHARRHNHQIDLDQHWPCCLRPPGAGEKPLSGRDADP